MLRCSLQHVKLAMVMPPTWGDKRVDRQVQIPWQYSASNVTARVRLAWHSFSPDRCQDSNLAMIGFQNQHQATGGQEQN